MKTLGLVIALTLVVGGASIAATETATIDLYAGWNQISCPLVPINMGTEANPELDFTEPYYAFINAGDDLLNGKLNRYDASAGGQYSYVTDEAFGKLLLGDGYQLNSSSATQVSYTGVENGVPDALGNKTDMWISLPGVNGAPTASPNGGGWHLVGVPYATDITAYDYNAETEEVTWHIFFTDGTEVVNWMDAVEVKGWVSDTFYGQTAMGQVAVNYATENSTLLSGQGYWFNTKQDNIAMIVIAPATAQ